MSGMFLQRCDCGWQARPGEMIPCASLDGPFYCPQCDANITLGLNLLGWRTRLAREIDGRAAGA